MQILVSVAGIVLMTVLAYYRSWSRDIDKPGANVGARTATARCPQSVASAIAAEMATIPSDIPPLSNIGPISRSHVGQRSRATAIKQASEVIISARSRGSATYEARERTILTTARSGPDRN